MSDTIVLTPPNTAPPVERVWMFVSRDEEGRENVCGVLMGPLGQQPLMTINPRVFELMKVAARELEEACQGTGRTIHLLCFTNREELEDWR
jgi:hypothetical protein